MVANRAYKFRMYPNDEQKILFAKTFGCVRMVYNHWLDRKIRQYEENKTNVTYTICAKEMAAMKKTEEYGFLKEADSIALQQSLRHLDTAFQNFFKQPKTGFPRFKSKKRNKNSYSTVCINGNITISNGYLKLPKIGQVRLKQHRIIPEEYSLKSVTVSQTPSGKYYASILFEYEDQVQEKEMQKFLGLDFSMHELYRDSNGKEPAYPGYYRNAEKKLAREQRKLSKMQKGSNNRNKQRLKVAKLHEKVSNQRKDFLHKQSRQITNAYDCVCIEDLDMKAMSRSLNFGKSVSDNGWGMFTTFLRYKLEEQGKKLQTIIDAVGNDAFLKIEEDCICGLEYNNTVIATGGSVVYGKKAMRHLHENGLVVYIRLPYEEIEHRLSNLATRGVTLKKGQTLHSLYDERIPLYEAEADYVFDAEKGDVEKTVLDLADQLSDRLEANDER